MPSSSLIASLAMMVPITPGSTPNTPAMAQDGVKARGGGIGAGGDERGHLLAALPPHEILGAAPKARAIRAALSAAQKPEAPTVAPAIGDAAID